MAYTDTNVNDLIINKLSRAQYDALNASGDLSDTELYYITDDDTYLKAPEGRLNIENGRVNLTNNLNSVYSITNNEVVMELNDDGLRYHNNAKNLDVNITPYYGGSDQTIDPATIKVNGIGLARETDLNGKQDKLVSGTSIKTINGESILGTGNINVAASGGGTIVKFIKWED